MNYSVVCETCRALTSKVLTSLKIALIDCLNQRNNIFYKNSFALHSIARSFDAVVLILIIFHKFRNLITFCNVIKGI